MATETAALADDQTQSRVVAIEYPRNFDEANVISRVI
jgi:hypothetical protein